MLRRVVGWVVLVPLSIALIVFALANRQLTVVNFNPIAPSSMLDAPSVGMPLFLVIFCFLLLGVVFGGVATWFAQGPIRRERRQWQREADRLARELEMTRRAQARNRSPAQLDVDDLVDSP